MSDATITVGTGGDDAQEATGGTVTLTTTSLDVDSSGDYIGFIVRDVPVPVGAIVTAAHINVWTSDSGRDSPNLTIRAEIDPANFTTTAYDLSGRTLTAEGVVWNASDIGINAYKTSPDITDVIQEIIDDGSWAEDDDIAMFLVQISGSGWLRMSAYEESSSHAAQLYIEWTEATSELTFAWPGDYWPDEYWSEYWPDYGSTPPPSSILPIIVHHLKQQGVM